MTWNEIINKIDEEIGNKLLIPKEEEENIEKRNLKETFKTMADDDFYIFYEVLKQRDKYEKEMKRLNNIIDELEKIINDYQITSQLDSDYELIYDLKNKIKESKENK